MPESGQIALAMGAAFSVLAALAHLACIAYGPRAYRFMGAGEKMARAVEAGRVRPHVVTLVISAALLMAAAYALSGAGFVGRLPFIKVVLVAITAVYLGRAFFFPLVRRALPENSTTFWLVSSAICLVIGLVHAFGLAQVWATL